MVESQENKDILPEFPPFIGSVLDITGSNEAEEFSGPFWNDNGASSIIIKSLKEIAATLHHMVEEGLSVKERLRALYAIYSFSYDGTPPEYPDSWLRPYWDWDRPVDDYEREYEAFYEEYVKLTSHYIELEHALVCSARTATLMAAIDLEAFVNRFCYYNLGEATADAIESLNPTEKLVVVHKALGLQDYKGLTQYTAARGLSKWRNAFAHGKCPNMPTNSLQENHIKQPKNQQSLQDTVDEAVKLLHNYIEVYSHLHGISRHLYTKGGYDLDSEEVSFLLKELERFGFRDDFTITYR